MECRVCLNKSDEIMDIFSQEHQHLMISDIIYKHLDFSPLLNNSTTVICVKCWLKVYKFHKFYQFVQEAQCQFKKMEQQCQDEQREIRECNITVKNKLLELNDILHEPMNVEIEKKEYVAMNSNVAENPLEELHISSSSASTIFSMVCFSESSDDELKLFKTENFNHPDDNDSCFQKPYTKSKNKHWVNKKHIKEKKGKRFNLKKNCSKVTETPLSPKLSESEMSALIDKYISMACDLCVFLGQSFSDLKNHFIKEHPKENPYVKCCNRKLTERYYLTKHALIHADPNQFKCIDCEKTFANNRFLRAHNLTHHASDEQKSHKCGVTYTCNECKTECTSRVGLNNHKRHAHSSKVHLCEICGKYFKKAIALKEHMTQHTGETLYKCLFCTRTFNAKSNMYAHKKRMHPMGWEKPSHTNSQKIVNFNGVYTIAEDNSKYNDHNTKYYMKKLR